MSDSLLRIAALARLIIIDGIKRYALIGLILSALAGEAGGLLFFDFIPRDIGRAANDFVFSISFLTGFIFLLFHAVQMAAWDDEHRTIHTFLARPISRTEYLLGIFSGLTFLLLLLNLILGGIAWTVLQLIKNSVGATYFQQLSASFFILAITGLYLIQLTLLSVIILFASVVRGNFPVLLLTLAYYCICNGLPVVRESVKQRTIENGGETFPLLLQCLTAVFPDFSRLDFKTLAINGSPPPPATQLCLIFSVSLLYIVIMLWFAAISFKKRDLM